MVEKVLIAEMVGQSSQWQPWEIVDDSLLPHQLTDFGMVKGIRIREVWSGLIIRKKDKSQSKDEQIVQFVINQK